LAVMGALWVRTVACGELHSSLLMRTVCRASGVYSERPRFFRLFIHAIEGQHRKIQHCCNPDRRRLSFRLYPTTKASTTLFLQGYGKEVPLRTIHVYGAARGECSRLTTR